MNFVKFPVSTTEIFPLANSTIGWQLLTERNQLLRDSVANHSNITYVCGPSYTHSANDFKISASGANIRISGGYAIVHGHFVYLKNTSAAAITINMTEAYRQDSSLSGVLCIGLRAMYSNYSTAAAAMLTDNGQNFYEGVQVVILPKSQFYLPENNGSGAMTPEGQVNAHLKLGEFTFYNNTISNVVQNDDKYKVLDGEKIGNLKDLLKDDYVAKTDLDATKLYLRDGSQNWTDATQTSMIWDAKPSIQSLSDPVSLIWLKDPAVSSTELLEQAEVRYDSTDDTTKLVVPHKQPDNMKSLASSSNRYIPREIRFPAANRATGEGGVLNKKWINFLNGLDDKIATMYRMPGGKMRRFISVLTSKDQLPKPPIAYYTEQIRDSAFYDNRLQYSFNLLQTQLAQLSERFVSFQEKLESEWKGAVTQDVTANMTEQYNDLRGTLDSLRQDLSTFQGDVASINSSIANSGSMLSSHIESAQNTIDAITRSAEAQYETTQELYSSLSSRVTALENRFDISTTEGGTSGGTSGGGVSSEEEDIEQLKKDVAALQSSLESTQSTLAQLNADLVTVSSNTDNLIDSTASTLDALYSSLYGSNKSGSSGDIKDAVTSITQLRSQYDYLYDAVHDLYNGITAEVEKATNPIYGRLLSELQQSIESQVAKVAEQYNVSADWAAGDYVLVAQDQTVTTNVTSDDNTFPSTMYVVVPGMVPMDSKYIASYYDVYTTDLSTPISPVTIASGTSTKDNFSNALDTYTSAVATLKRHVPASFLYGYELGSNDVQELNSADDLPDVYNSTIMLEELYNSNVMTQGVRGTPGKDYFVLRYRYPKGSPQSGTYIDEMTGESFDNISYQVYTWVSVFFTLNLVSDKVELDVDNPIILSGGTPYAEENRVGGFLNVGSDVYGGGYVSRDDEGHLRLNDFELLAAGVSAYQLGEDRTEGAGLDMEELQSIFDQYVNQRIAFPNTYQLYKASQNNLRTDVITLELNIGSTSEGTLNIYDIDSRFNTAVNLKISGSATENVVISITNCQRLKITLDQTSHPTIILNNVCLYYDADVIDRIAQIRGLTLWYERYNETDPTLEIDGMTVMYQGRLEPKGTETFWSMTSGNDNIYAYALRQITFASDGTIIGMGIAMTDNTTANAMPVGESIFAKTFQLPQSIGLSYPITRLTKQIKVTGNFVTAYQISSGFTVKNTNFTILTQKYQTYGDIRESLTGTISFYTKTTNVASSGTVDPDTLMNLGNVVAIDGWESGAYHIFYGGVIE